MDEEETTIIMQITGRPRRMQRRLSPHVDTRQHEKRGIALEASTGPSLSSLITKNLQFNLDAVNDHEGCCSLSPLVSVQPSEIWYTKKDYKKMKQREAQLIEELARTYPKSAFAIDGVESVEYRRQKIDRVHKARHCVLKLQSLPQEVYAMVYGNSTRVSSELAREMGEFNAKEVITIWSNEEEGEADEEQHDPSVCDDVSGTSGQEFENIRFTTSE
jgi:hypothetical protein